MSIRHTLPLGAALALLACSDALGPLNVAEPYLLRTINGQPVPWTLPPADSQYIPGTITEGWITILNDSVAERHERFGRWVLNPNGDSIPLFGEWTQTGSYERPGGRIIVLSYHFYVPGSLGPLQPVDTLFITRQGGLILRETGFVAPLDSLIREYCTTPSPC
jgi:hypothetical protein